MFSWPQKYKLRVCVYVKLMETDTIRYNIQKASEVYRHATDTYIYRERETHMFTHMGHIYSWGVRVCAYNTHSHTTH